MVARTAHTLLGVRENVDDVVQEASVRTRAALTIKVYEGSELRFTVILFPLAIPMPRHVKHPREGRGKMHKSGIVSQPTLTPIETNSALSMALCAIALYKKVLQGRSEQSEDKTLVRSSTVL